MKDWKAPELEELNVNMTAGEASGDEGDNRFPAVVDAAGNVISRGDEGRQDGGDTDS